MPQPWINDDLSGDASGGVVWGNPELTLYDSGLFWWLRKRFSSKRSGCLKWTLVFLGLLLQLSNDSLMFHEFHEWLHKPNWPSVTLYLYMFIRKHLYVVEESMICHHLHPSQRQEINMWFTSLQTTNQSDSLISVIAEIRFMVNG